MAKSSFRVELEHAEHPLVLALDVGSTATRGCLYDAHGRPAGNRVKVAHAFVTTTDRGSTIDPDLVLGEVCEVIDGLLDQPGVDRVAGVAIDTFASSLVGVDGLGRALTPCYTYADARCSAEVDHLRAEVDEAELQQRTGTRLHTSYLPARLRWLAAVDRRRFDHVQRWVSLSEYVHLHLIGTTGAGTSVAAWSGLLDRRTAAWDPTMLALAGIDVDRLSRVHHPDQPLVDAGGSTGDRWPALRAAQWFCGVADGFAANVGNGAGDATTMGLSAATSGAARVVVPGVPDTVPSGLWCYRVAGDRSIVGGAMNDVGRVVDWLDETLRLPSEEGALDALLTAEPSDVTPLVLPYLTGERATGWASSARAHVSGLTVSSGPEAIARGALEGVALVYARIAAQLRDVSPDVVRVVASGRVSQDLPGLLQLVADALGTPVTPVTIKRATLHGTALLALETLAPDAERTPPDTGPTLEPAPGRVNYWEERRARFAEAYAALVAQG
ncbi:gluconokinase [Mariniluteicoccus flavus]